MIPIEIEKPSTSAEPPTEVRIKPVWPDPDSQTIPKVPSSSGRSQLSDRHIDTKQDSALPPVVTSRPSEDFGATTRPEETDFLEGYVKAYELYQQRNYLDGYAELFKAIEKTGGKTPAAVFQRLEMKQGTPRTLFEAARGQIEAHFRQQKEAESRQQRNGR